MPSDIDLRRRQLLIASGLMASGVAHAQGERVINVLDYLTPEQVVDVKNWTYRFDVAPAIEKAAADAQAAGGGTVLLPAGGYLLGTLSKELHNAYSYIAARDGVNIRGEGMNRTVLKVKAGENVRLNGTNGPNIIGTQKPEPLRNCSYSYFSVDWDGPNNLLKQTDTPRQNCTLLSVNGGINITCTEVRSISTPGNQCIMLPAFREQGQGNVRLIRCEAFNCGSGLPGNYNNDHSSFYVNGTDLHYEGLRGEAVQEVRGALYELHGTNARAMNCLSINYQLGLWIAANFQPIKNIRVTGDRHLNCRCAFSLSGETEAIDNVEIADCEFRQAEKQPSAGPLYFVNGNTVTSCNLLHVHDCAFLGQSFPFMRFMQLFKIARLRFESNRVEGFDNYGVLAAGLDLGNGRFIDELIVENNTFIDVKRAVYANVPALAAGRIVVRNNRFHRSMRDPAPPITIVGRSSTGQLGPNAYSENYVQPVENLSRGAQTL